MADDRCRLMGRELMLPAHQSRRRAKSISKLALALVALFSTTACQADSQTFSPEDKGSPLRLERRIALPGVAGRIDHLAIDLPRHILFVAEYGNGTVDAVDIKSGRVLWRITGLHEVQGIAAVSNGQQVVVACGDGTVHFYATIDQHQVAALSLGDDADDVRIDQRNSHVVVGYGTGGLAIIDPSTHQLISRMHLPGHPEGFDLSGNRVIIKSKHPILADGIVSAQLSYGDRSGGPVVCCRISTTISAAIARRQRWHGSRDCWSLRRCG